MELTTYQIQRIREYLEQQGLTFEPLRDELVDHLRCDLELRMAEGSSFDTAWTEVTAEIGDNHFQQIQTQVMETINRRFTWSQGLSLSALGLLFISAVFKILHLQFAGELLIVSFVFIGAALLTASLTGVFLNRGKEGAARVMSMIAGILLMLTGYAFKLLHFSGGDQLILIAVAVLMISLLANTLHVYRNASGHSNLLTYLHEKYTPGLERFFLILLLPHVVYSSIMILTDKAPANFILLVVIFGAGMQFIAMCWRIMEKNLTKRNSFILLAIITSAVCLILPFLGPLVPFELRVGVIVLFSIVSGWLAFKMEEAPRRLTSLIMGCLVPVIFTGWALIRLDLIPASAQSVFFNIPVIIVLTAGLLLTRKDSTMRAFMLVSLASYLFEYMM